MSDSEELRTVAIQLRKNVWEVTRWAFGAKLRVGNLRSHQSGHSREEGTFRHRIKWMCVVVRSKVPYCFFAMKEDNDSEDGRLPEADRRIWVLPRTNCVTSYIKRFRCHLGRIPC